MPHPISGEVLFHQVEDVNRVMRYRWSQLIKRVYAAPPFTGPAPLYFMQEDGEWKIDGLFSFKNIIYGDGQHWFWRNPNIDNEKQWIGM